MLFSIFLIFYSDHYHHHYFFMRIMIFINIIFIIMLLSLYIFHPIIIFVLYLHYDINYSILGFYIISLTSMCINYSKFNLICIIFPQGGDMNQTGGVHLNSKNLLSLNNMTSTKLNFSDEQVLVCTLLIDVINLLLITIRFENPIIQKCFFFFLIYLLYFLFLYESIFSICLIYILIACLPLLSIYIPNFPFVAILFISITLCSLNYS